MGDKKTFRIKIIMFIVFAAVITVVSVLMIPMAEMIATAEGRSRIEQIMRENMILGVFIYILMQALQVIVALIPGGPVQIMGGILFGEILGFILCVLGIFLGTAAVYYLVKWLGYPLVEAVINKKHIRHIKFFEDTKKVETVIFILFLIPGMPKDAFTYLVPLTKVKPKTFFVLAMTARLPALFMSTYFGSSLEKGDYVAAIIVSVIVLATGIIGIMFKEKIFNFIRTKFKSKSK